MGRKKRRRTCRMKAVSKKTKRTRTWGAYPRCNYTSSSKKCRWNAGLSPPASDVFWRTAPHRLSPVRQDTCDRCLHCLQVLCASAAPTFSRATSILMQWCDQRNTDRKGRALEREISNDHPTQRNQASPFPPQFLSLPLFASSMVAPARAQPCPAPASIAICHSQG